MLKKSVVAVCCLIFSGALFSGEPVKPEMDSAGKITEGSKSISLKNGYLQVDMVVGNVMSIFGTSLMDLGKGDTSPVFFRNKKILKHDKSQIIWGGDMVPKRGEKDIIGKYQISLELRKDNLIDLSCECKLNPGVNIKSNSFYLGCQGGEKLKGYYSIGKVKTDIKPGKLLRVAFAEGLEFTFFPGAPSRKFKIIPKTYLGASLNPEAGRISFIPADGKIKLLLDFSGEKSLKRSGEYYGGIDFEKIDSLHLPQYRKCRNLIQNPSFEADMRYWGYKSFGSHCRPELVDIYNIDTENSKFGNKSLRIKAHKHLSLALANFAVPLKPGKKYILSFYAKGSLPEGLRLRLDGRATVTWWMFKDKKRPLISVNDKWERYNVSFVPKEEFYSIFIQGMLSGKSKANQGFIWIDGIQLEEGKLTEYTELPVAMKLATVARGNFLNFGQKPDFELKLHTAPSRKGSIDLNVNDFFANEIFKRNYKFTADKKGNAVIKLPEIDKKIFDGKLRGVFTVRAMLTFDGEKEPYRDYFRFSVMAPLKNKHKNKNIFCFTGSAVCNVLCTDGADRRLARLRDVGFGSSAYVSYSDRETEKRLYSKIKEYGFADVGHHVINKRKQGGTIEEDGMILTNIRNMIDVTPEQLKKYEKICEAKARKRPWVSVWYFAGEIEALKPFVEDSESLGKILNATLRGIKKGNPDAKVHMGGTPWNIDESGRKWYNKYMKAVTAVAGTGFDGTAIHIYRQMPENPDLDAATASFIEILKKYGYENKPVYWDEGGNYFEYFIPGRAMTPYYGNSGDKWYQGMLTYDMGNAERIAAAFSARTWLVALKYMKNIACLQDWSIRRYFWDFDLTVGAKMKVVNTIARILGNSSFYKDIRFAPECRCYMFIDENKRPVAAVWGYNLDVDKWRKKAPIFKFDFGKQKLEFKDLMETSCTFPVENGKTLIPVGSFPMFIVGEPGMGKELADSIAGAVKKGGTEVPVEVNAWPVSEDKAELSFGNELSTVMNAEAFVEINGEKLKYSLGLKPLENLVRTAGFDAGNGAVKKFDFSVVMKSGRYIPVTVKTEGSYGFINSVSGITLDGRSDDWKDIPEMPLSKECGLKIAISGGIMYIAVSSQKPMELPLLLVNAKPEISDWADFKKREQDIYVYEMRGDKDGKLNAFARFVPGVQADSGDWTPKVNRISRYIKGIYSENEGKGFAEIAVQADAVMPLKLVKGEKFGINIILKDNKALLSFAPIRNFRDTSNPGEFKLVLEMIK